MNVVRGVAGIARRGRTFKGEIAMASNTSSFVMCAQQSELRLAVVEVDRLEALHIVARGTVGTELAQVDIVGFMAIHAGMGSVTVLLVGLVAGSTGHRRMRAFQLKVRLLVTEGVGLKADNIGGATLVLTMAASTTRIGRQSTAVEALTALHVRGDVLVARQAEVAHARLIGAVMATGALLLVLGMGSRQLAWHQERFERGRRGKPRRKEQANSQYCLQTTHETAAPQPTAETTKPRATLAGVRGLKAELPWFVHWVGTAGLVNVDSDDVNHRRDDHEDE